MSETRQPVVGGSAPANQTGSNIPGDTTNGWEGVLSAVQLDQLLSFLSYSNTNRDRTDSLANIGLETVTLEALCQRFAATFPLKSDAFKVTSLKDCKDHIPKD